VTRPGVARAVAIGGSAGAIDALMVLLPVLPRGLPVPVFVVVHLPPGRPSLLAEIFAARCALAVCEAEDKQPVRPGCDHFAPPDYHLLVDDGPQLALAVDDPVHFSRPAIDVLFESAADVYREGLVGIVLSGGSADGAAGLAAVRRAGGQAWVQSPDSAQVPTMPQHAIAQCPQASVINLNEMHARLLAWAGTADAQ
jgi:two-component system chemotaxis response regulator CheB